MGRANGRQHGTETPRRATPSGAVDMDALFADAMQNKNPEPDWWTPGSFAVDEALRFSSEGTTGGLPIDPAVALKLLQIDFDSLDPQTGLGTFWEHHNWYAPSKRHITAPDKTCAGMSAAAQALSETIDRGELIAVYCDYDVDGTAAGAVFQRGLAPYDAKLHYGYADAQQGFGLTNDFVHEAHAAGAKMLVTLDCGTGQAQQVELAQSLGMQVIVVDHHNIAENPAEYHLNPKVPAPDGHTGPWPNSDNTGAQLSWKLTAALQAHREGRTRSEHWETSLQLAGMGCLADMGSVMLHENRAFFWLAPEHASPGVRALAERLGEDPTVPGRMIATQAALNLPKRTALVDAADVGAILNATTVDEAAPYIDKLLTAYQAGKEARLVMIDDALAQTGVAQRHDDGSTTRPVQADDDDYIAFAVLGDEHSTYSGYTGPVASSVSSAAQKPAVIFAPRGEDEDGNPLYKFSSRNSSSARLQLGGLIEDEAMQAACTIARRNESGEIALAPVLGGHAEVVSGSCTAANVDQVLGAMRNYAKKIDQKNRDGLWPGPWDGAEAYLSERKVAPQRLPGIEKDMQRMGPFTRGKQHLYPSYDPNPERREKKAANKELNISMHAKFETSAQQDEAGADKWLDGTLVFDDGQRRAARWPRNEGDPPAAGEFVLRVDGSNSPYYLRTVHPDN